MRRLVLTVALGALLAACSAELPEPESAGAHVLAARCGGCHRLYAPGLMTFEMWKVQLDKMHRLFAQRGIPWMPAEEEAILVDYLRRHAGTA